MADNQKHNMGNQVRKWFRIIHRELSYLFAGMLLVYAISGIALNHKATYNSQYTIERTEFQVPMDSNLQATLDVCNVKDKVIQYYQPDTATTKVFLKNNSTLTIDHTTHKAVLEQVKIRPILGNLSKLHYNPNKAWTWFSDMFGVSMVIVVLTGLFMLKGKNSLWGIGGIEFCIGVLIPLLFIFV